MIAPCALGERAFDFANIVRNPDAATALAPGRFEHQIALVSRSASLERRRLLEWTVAFAGLSASWHLADGTSPALDLDIADDPEADPKAERPSPRLGPRPRSLA